LPSTEALPKSKGFFAWFFRLLAQIAPISMHSDLEQDILARYRNLLWTWLFRWFKRHGCRRPDIGGPVQSPLGELKSVGMLSIEQRTMT
jgi:hypothetical protein